MAPGDTLVPVTPAGPPVLLGTVAIEPNRWGTIDASGAPTIQLSQHLATIAAAGFDGLELWDRHLTAAPPAEVDAVLGGTVPVTVFNSYADLDDPDPTERAAVAAWVARTGATGVKFNVGNDPAEREAYAERIAAWLELLPAGVTLLCECHARTSIAEDPDVAAALFERAGPVGAVQAIVHTHEDPEQLRIRFARYGERITHVHVNFLDPRTARAPALADVRDELRTKVALLRAEGFRGSWTIEFVAGLLSDDDHPAPLLEHAARDLVTLREVFEESRR